MDINIIYNKIIEKLKASNNLDEISNIEKSSDGTATDSEALMATGYYFFD